MKLTVFYFLVLISITFSCKEKAQSTIITLEAKEFHDKTTAISQPQIIDIRSPNEFATENISNAVYVQWNGKKFAHNLQEFDQLKSLFIYDNDGITSEEAAKNADSLGFKNIYLLKGGFNSWKSSIYNKTTDKRIGMSKQQFNSLLNGDKNILINFSEKSCDPCEQMTPYLTELQKEFSKNLIIINIDTEENKTLIQEMNIEIVPYFILYKTKNIVWQHGGLVTKEELKKQFHSLIQ